MYFSDYNISEQKIMLIFKKIFWYKIICKIQKSIEKKIKIIIRLRDYGCQDFDVLICNMECVSVYVCVCVCV